MASDECTKSGTSLWLMLDFLFMGFLIVDLGFLRDIWISNEELGAKVALLGTTAVVGTISGLAIMHQGLGNKLFDMSMRVTLVTVGVIIASATILTSAVLALTFP